MDSPFLSDREIYNIGVEVNYSIFLEIHGESLLGVVLSAGLLVSCSENNEPESEKGANNATFFVESISAPASFLPWVNQMLKVSTIKNYYL